jgi:PAS domain S-box-containing protein
MLLADQEARIIFINPAGAELLGSIPENLEGRIGFELCHPDSLPAVRQAFERCLSQPGTAGAVAVCINRPDGATRTMDVKLVNRLHQPEVAAVVVHFQEAPGAVQAEYQVLFDRAPIGLGVADSDGILLAFNDAMLEPGGYTRADIEQIRTVARLYHDEADRDRILSLARERGFVWREEVRFRRKDGTAYDTLLTLVPVQLWGRSCWYAAVEDITERKRAEADRARLELQLWQSHKMEAVGKMTAGIVHDFNNLLSVVSLSADLLAEGIVLDQAALRTEVDNIHQAVTLGSAMVKKLLGYCRHAPLQREPADLAHVVKHLESILRRVLPSSIEVDIRAETGSVAQVDVPAVEQMLLNLATNARDAMPGGGRLVIDVRPVELTEGAAPSWMRPGRYVRVAARDTGIGMDETVRSRALEPFFTTKPASTGTGLGLAMVYGLIKQHDGFVELESEVGQGTTVKLYFPPEAQ